MNKIFFVLSIILLLFIPCKRQMPLKQAKAEIEGYLDNKYSNQFSIDSIGKLYSVDLFPYQIGFEVWLSDNHGIHFGPVRFEKNKYQGGWITFYGPGIDEQYNKAQQKDSVLGKKNKHG